MIAYCVRVIAKCIIERQKDNHIRDTLDFDSTLLLALHAFSGYWILTRLFENSWTPHIRWHKKVRNEQWDNVPGLARLQSKATPKHQTTLGHSRSLHINENRTVIPN